MAQNPTDDDKLPDLDPDVEKVLNAKFVKPLEERNKKLEEQYQQMLAEQTRREVSTHNSTTIDAVINEYGIAWENKPEQVEALRKAKELLYPNLDLSTQKLNKAQALALFAQAGIQQKGTKGGPKQTDRIRTAAKAAAKAPKIMAGNKGQGRVNQKRAGGESESASRQDRLQAYKEMFG